MESIGFLTTIGAILFAVSMAGGLTVSVLAVDSESVFLVLSTLATVSVVMCLLIVSKTMGFLTFFGTAGTGLFTELLGIAVAPVSVWDKTRKLKKTENIMKSSFVNRYY